MALEDSIKTLWTIINLNYIYEIISHVTGNTWAPIYRPISCCCVWINCCIFFRRFIYCETRFKLL